jgi:hypothetical protein
MFLLQTIYVGSVRIALPLSYPWNVQCPQGTASYLCLYQSHWSLPILAVGGENFSPARVVVSVYTKPAALQAVHLFVLANGVPSFFTFLTCPVP